MRLLQLSTGPGEILDLHPNLTVVVGLDDAGHEALVASVAGLSRSEAVRDGLLEAHGILFDLEPSLLSVLRIDSDGLDPVVRFGQLPSQPLSVDARELRTREQEFEALLARIAAQVERQSDARGRLAAATRAVEEARRARKDAEAGAATRLEGVDSLTVRLDQLVEARRRGEEELAGLQRELADASSTRARVEEATAEVRHDHDRARTALAEAEAALLRLDAEIDAEADQAVDEARSELQRVEAEVEAERAAEATGGGQGGGSTVPARARLEELDGRARELDRHLAVLAPVDPTRVAEALTTLQGRDAGEQVPSVEAAAIADELDRIGTDLGDEQDGSPEVGSSLATARARLDDARQALLEAEQAVRSPELDRDDVNALEDAHAALLDAIDRADRRMAGARARQRVDDLRAAEREILDRLGFGSYSDYVMGYSLHHVDPEQEAALDAARAELAAAEDEWTRIEAETDVALARAALLDRRRTLQQEARRLLGGTPDGDLQAALRALRVPRVSLEAAAGRLAEALAAAGVELGGEEPDAEELALMAEAWLDEVEQSGGRREALASERAELEAERAAVAAEVAELDLEAAALARIDPEELRAERLASARSALAAAEERVAASRAAEEQRAALAHTLEEAAAAEADARAAAHAAAAEVEATRAVERPLAARIEELDAELVEIRSEAERIDEALRSLSEPAPDRGELDRRVSDAEREHADALAAVEQEDRAVAALDAEGRAAALEIERLQDIVAAQTTGTSTPAEELEWYLLARLAAQRSVSVAGSLPLVLDDALRGVAGEDVAGLLDRLERMAEAVQVIIISEDPLVAAWAEAAGPGRAAVVAPGTL
jgi:hypothetical protein